MPFFFFFFFKKETYQVFDGVLNIHFQVDLRFPQSGAADPNLVTVIGRPELVDEAIDHLLNLEEEYVSFCEHKNIKVPGEYCG